MKKNIFVNIVKIILGLSIIEPIIVCLLFNFVWMDNIEFYNVKYYMRLIPIVVINILLLLLMMKNKRFNKIILGIIILIYLCFSALIPVYNLSSTAEPTGPNSYLMGLSIKINRRNAYWMDITGIYKFF